MKLKATAPWSIVLAGGDGVRLRPLTRALHGEDLPKQFALIRNGHSLLESTVERTRWVCTEDHTLVVVARERERIARAQLSERDPRLKLVLQPRNLGTATGLLLALAELRDQAADDVALIVPADHFVADLDPFVATLRQAIETAARSRAIVMVGAVADSPETEYGWIVPSEGGPGGCRSVLRFVEKPSIPLARALLRDGALWNTFVFAAPIRTLLDRLAACIPAHVADFADYQRAIGTPNAARILTAIYQRLPAADFSRDVLTRLSDLLVVSLAPCGWSDWGTPERVFESLRGDPELSRLEERLAKSDGSAGIRAVLSKTN